MPTRAKAPPGAGRKPIPKKEKKGKLVFYVQNKYIDDLKTILQPVIDGYIKKKG